ncbi:MAG: hypothetical protein ACK4N5_25895, partial [Myxococcales bacterium]
MSYTDLELSPSAREAFQHHGFLCWYDPVARCWRLAGSRRALASLCDSLATMPDRAPRVGRRGVEVPWPFLRVGPRERARISRDGI